MHRRIPDEYHLSRCAPFGGAHPHVGPTNGNNFSRANIPELDAKMNQLDKAYMEQAAWAPYGNEQFVTFVSDRIDFDKVYHHLLFNHDYSSLALK